MPRSFPTGADRQMEECSLDISLYRQVRKQTVMLGNEADRPFARRSVLFSFGPDLSPQRHACLPDGQQAGNGAQDRGLAAAGRAHQSRDAAVGNLGGKIEGWTAVAQLHAEGHVARRRLDRRPASP